MVGEALNASSFKGGKMTHNPEEKRSLSPEKAGLLLILVSLFFAGAMMLSSHLLKGTGIDSQNVSHWLIALWFIPFSYLSVKGSTGRKRARCRVKIRN